jgi:Phage P22-like portal protein
MPYTAIDSAPDLGAFTDTASVNPRHAAILTRARKRYAASVEAEREIREEAELDMRFVAGDQWTEKARRERESAFRPVLTFNKLHTPVQQLANQARQNKPAIQIHPAGGGSSKDDALVFQGLIRSIEYDSSADQAYDIALESAASCGFGFFRYNTVYVDNHSFDQKLVVESIQDAFSIRLDCAAKKPDRSDAMWAFEELTVSRDSYRIEYGREPVDTGIGGEFAREMREEGWITDDEVRLCRYWEVQLDDKTLRHYKGADGIYQPVYVEDLDGGEADRDDIDWLTDDEGDIQERTVQIRKVVAYMVDGANVLDETPWDGSHIPIFAVLGKEIVVRGKRKLISLIRHSRDPQTLHNYYKTMEAETIALAPKPKWIGAVGQFKSKQRDWQRANLDMAAYLEYDPVEKNGAMIGPPTWEAFDPPVQALNSGALMSADDIKAGTGFFDPSLGMQKSDQSGVAVQKLQNRGDISNFHFIDNLARALKWLGLQFLEIIPKKYDTERELEIVGVDNRRSVIKVNAPYRDEKGRIKHHVLSAGRFSVLVSMGASYESQKAENFARLTELCQGNPQFLQLAGDIIIENSDIVGADRLAARLRAALPPAIAAADQSLETGIPPEVAQLRASLQQLQQQNAQLQAVIKGKVVEMASKERQTTQTNRTRMAVAEAQSRNAAVNEQFERDHDALQSMLDRRADLLGTMLTLQQEADQAERDRQHDQQMSQQAQVAQQQAQQPAMAGA